MPSCAEAGILGALTGVIGTLQALEVIKLITGIGEPLVGRLLLYDALAARFDTIRYKRRRRERQSTDPGVMSSVLARPGFTAGTTCSTLILHSFAYMDDRIDPPSSALALTAASLAAKAEAEIAYARDGWRYASRLHFPAAGDGLPLMSASWRSPRRRRAAASASATADACRRNEPALSACRR